MTSRVRADLVGRPLGDLLAVVEDGDPVADAHDHLHVVLDEQDGQPELGPELVDQRHHLRPSRAGSCRPSARRAGAASARCASARATSSRRWSPYGRFFASSSPRPRRPTSASSSSARSRDAISSRRFRGVESIASTRLRLELDVHPDEDVLHRGHVLEQADVLEGPAEPGLRPCRSGRALRKIPSRASRRWYHGRPGDGRDQHHDQRRERQGSPPMTPIVSDARRDEPRWPSGSPTTIAGGRPTRTARARPRTEWAIICPAARPRPTRWSGRRSRR